MHRIQVVAMVIIAFMLGALIALVDATPGWDDTGVTAAAILIASGLLGVIHPRQARIWALVVGLWMPLLSIALHGSATPILGMVLPLAFALGGA